MTNSPIDFHNLREFRLSVDSLRRFYLIGKDKGNKSLVHIAYLHREPVGDKFSLDVEFVKINPYCKQYLLKSSSVIIGVIFVAQKDKVDLRDSYMCIGKMKSTKKTEPSYALEQYGILSYKSFDGSVLLVSSTIESDLLIKDE